ncbi:MAG: hypothetical protein LBU67_02415 [Oscillospiraceae bacterium]|nr:hypothetical protein [Oscillospiraceae bacterium]
MRVRKMIAVLCALALVLTARAAWAADEAAPTRLAEGWKYVQAQATDGMRLEADFALEPGSLPIPGSPQRDALLALLGGMRVQFAHQATQTGDGLSLALDLLGQPFFAITRVTDGQRARWSSPAWPQDVQLPAEVNLWAALFGDQGGVGASQVFAQGDHLGTAPAQDNLLSLLRILPPRVIMTEDQALALWYAALQALGAAPQGTPLETWRPVGETTLESAWDEAGDWTALIFSTAISTGTGAPWQVAARFTRQAVGKAYRQQAQATLTRGEGDALTVDWSRETTASGKSGRKQQGSGSIKGSLGGHALTISLKERHSNTFATDKEGVLSERIRQSWAFSLRTDDPRWAEGGMHAWQGELAHSGTLRSGPTPQAPVAWEGEIALTLKRGSNGFFTGKVPWQLRTAPPQVLPTGVQPLVWEGLGEDELTQLRGWTWQGLAQTLRRVWALLPKDARRMLPGIP